MSYNDLLKLLLSNKVYYELKNNEHILFELIPELKECKGFKQNNDWHIYDVYEHILHVVSGTKPNLYLRLSALFHDIGKPFTYIEDDKKVGHFYNHWNKSIEIFIKYQDKFDLPNEEITLITNLIFYHDLNVEKLDSQELDNMISIIGAENIGLLFSLKRADLLAQSPKYHHLIDKIDNQEHKLVKSLKK